MAKILVVDGNVKIRLLTVRLLETKPDWEICEAADGHEAIAKVSQLKPDLVVLDFAMPGLNGFETARKIVAQFPHLPIILYTFYGIEGMNIEAQKHGISEVVDKTASGDKLLETIEKHLGRRANAAATASETIARPEDKEEEPQGLN